MSHYKRKKKIDLDPTTIYIYFIILASHNPRGYKNKACKKHKFILLIQNPKPNSIESHGGNNLGCWMGWPNLKFQGLKSNMDSVWNGQNREWWIENFRLDLINIHRVKEQSFKWEAYWSEHNDFDLIMKKEWQSQHGTSDLKIFFN